MKQEEVGNTPIGLKHLFESIASDVWRRENRFSADLESAAVALHKSSLSQSQREVVLSSWLALHQPCLFGRIAAKQELISYCFIEDSDLLEGDLRVHKLIQDARTAWKRKAMEGRKSAFVIALLSQRLLYAEPNEQLLSLAQRIAELYLETEIQTNKIYLDELQLEIPNYQRNLYRWDVGVNVFAAAGDLRWWHDHRFPCGLAFSMNSVGHLVKSGMNAKLLGITEDQLGVPVDDLTVTKVESLPKALEFAMRTIKMASDKGHPKATSLRPSQPDAEPPPSCPFAMPPTLNGFDCRTYTGRYDTDQTLPREYFYPDPQRAEELPEHDLDLTYLFDESIYNYAYRRIATGILQRGEPGSAQRDRKRRKSIEQVLR